MPAAKRFELPALDFKFASLTDGTDIPPPLPSPVKEVPTPPATPKATPNGKENATDKANGTASNGTNGATKAANGSLKRPAEDLPLSPALSSRQGSIRRLFSRNLLNNAYAEGETAPDGTGLSPGRPASRADSSVLDDKKARRGSGWFRRLRTGDSTVPKRTSSLYEPVTPKKLAGPPPPMIPELSALKNKLDVDDGGSLGNNLFGDIK